MLFACSPCCGCDYPATPDSIEIEITDTTTEYASLVYGQYENKFCDGEAAEAAVGLLFRAPTGVFTLEPQEPADGTFRYADDFHEMIVSLNPTPIGDPPTSHYAATLLLDLVRVKWNLGDTPPSQAGMEPEAWADNCVGQYHPPLPTYIPAGLGDATYTLPKCAGVTRASVSLSHNCVVATGSQSRTPATGGDDNRVVAAQVCHPEGCTYPATVSVQYGGISLWPHPSLLFVTFCPRVGLSQYRKIFSSAGNIDSYGVASGSVSFSIARVSLVFGAETVDLFSPFGDSPCAANLDGPTACT